MIHIEIFNKIHHLIGTPYVESVEVYIAELTGFRVEKQRLVDNAMKKYQLVQVVTRDDKIVWFEIFK
ncbi:hypothetical protein [Pseudomonas sp. GW456-12-1-14-TSB6]|uniref:hypothetical protein n=1 Tax=Pseudomonas sp. GW456-12-1-14-TSB6 TaxID=2751350 RepID=UPI000CD18F3F|nr:hypothetical protein [Pseudomonas sp. GW456-12-1-14-TSB6]POA38100.1 hypothetical protein C1891_09845 [Pseudomonas sp. GW456-12-1-14-TSB6]